MRAVHAWGADGRLAAIRVRAAAFAPDLHLIYTDGRLAAIRVCARITHPDPGR
jgi:hypothetical protein